LLLLLHISPLLLQMEPAVSSCLLAAYASLRDCDSGTANAHIEKGFQYSLARWWQVSDVCAHAAGNCWGSLPVA
jgi:hypothetical protein